MAGSGIANCAERPSAGQVKQIRLLPKQVFLIPPVFGLRGGKKRSDRILEQSGCVLAYLKSLYIAFLTLKMKTFGLEKWLTIESASCSFRRLKLDS